MPGFRQRLEGPPGPTYLGFSGSPGQGIVVNDPVLRRAPGLPVPLREACWPGQWPGLSLGRDRNASSSEVSGRLREAQERLERPSGRLSGRLKGGSRDTSLGEAFLAAGYPRANGARDSQEGRAPRSAFQEHPKRGARPSLPSIPRATGARASWSGQGTPPRAK